MLVVDPEQVPFLGVTQNFDLAICQQTCHPKGLAYQQNSNLQYISSAVEAETWSKKERWEWTSSTCPCLFIPTIEMS